MKRTGARTYVPSLGYHVPDYMLAYTGKTRIVFAVPRGMATIREFMALRGLSCETVVLPGHWRPVRHRPLNIMSVHACYAWKKRGDYARVRLRIGRHPFVYYVGLYPVEILEEALKRAQIIAARKRRALEKRERRASA